MQRRVRALSVLVVALVTIAGGAGGASAAAPWSEPQSTSGDFSRGLERVSFGTGGHLFVAGLRQLLPSSSRVGRVLAAPVEDGKPGQPRESTASLHLGEMRLYGRDGVVAGGHLNSGGVSPHVALTRGRLGRPLGRPKPLRGRSRSSHLLDLVVNEVGDAAAAVRWCQTQGCGRQTLEVFRWRAGARLSRPRRIARGRGLGAGVALNAHGDVAIVWDRRSGGRQEVVGQILMASGKLRRAQRLGAVPAAPKYRIALTDDRRVVAAWVAQRVEECFAHPGGEIAVAQAAKGGRFGRARRLTSLAVTGCGRYVSGPGVQFARARDGRVLIAWSGNEGRRWVVRAGELGAAGVDSVAVVSDRASDAVVADLAVGPRGEAIVLLADGVGGSDPTGPTRLLAVTRGAAPGIFAAPELVADRAGISSSVAFDPTTGRATVAYGAVDAQFRPITSVVTRDPIAP